MKQEYITPTTQIVLSLIDTPLMWDLAGSGTHGETKAPAQAPAPTHNM